MGTHQPQDSVFLEYVQAQGSQQQQQLTGSPGQQQRAQLLHNSPRSQAAAHKSEHDAVAVTSALRALVAAHRIHAQRQGVLQVQQDRQALHHVADWGLMDGRLAQLERASAVLQDVVRHSDTLALRFKDVSSKQTVPVENEFQPHFSSLMAHAAADSYALQHGRDGLDWALHFNEPPSQWEQNLVPLDAVHAMCTSYQASVSKFGTSKLC